MGKEQARILLDYGYTDFEDSLIQDMVEELLKNESAEDIREEFDVYYEENVSSGHEFDGYDVWIAKRLGIELWKPGKYKNTEHYMWVREGIAEPWQDIGFLEKRRLRKEYENL